MLSSYGDIWITPPILLGITYAYDILRSCWDISQDDLLQRTAQLFLQRSSKDAQVGQIAALLQDVW